MNLVSMRRHSYAVIVGLVVLSSAITLLADPPEAPLAKATDINFSVEYSTDRLMLGDILYAEVTIRNKTDHTIRISKFDGLIIRAEHPTASEIVCSAFVPDAVSLLELAPGEEVVQSRILDMFGNDGLEDGEFNPFDQALEGQAVVLHAEHSTLVYYQLKGVDYHDALMKHVQEIQLGPAMIGKAAFDEAVAATLKRADLEPLKLFFEYGVQSSYLFTQSMEPVKRSKGPQNFAARLHVMSQELPKQSSARRAASVLLQVDRFVTADGDVEDQAISSILSLLDEAPPMEQRFWRDLLLSSFRSARVIGTANQHIVSKDKYDRFAKRMAEAEI